MSTLFKKAAAMTMALAVATTVFAGCGSKTGSTTSTGTTQAAAKTTVKVWTYNRSDADYAQEKVKNFNDTNKDGINLEYTIYSDNYSQTLELAFASNQAPDVFFNDDSIFGKYVTQGYFVPLDEFLTPDYKKRFGDGGFIEGVNVIDGKTYTLPAIGSTPRLIYNKGIFLKAGIAAPPKSVAEMAQYAKQISDKLKSEGVYGFAANLKSPASAFGRSIVQILERSGYPIKDGFNFKTGKYDFAPYAPILTAYKDIFTTNAAFPGSESLDIDPLRTQFAAGKIGMYMSWTHAEPAVYANQFPTKEDWAVADIPTIDGTVKGSQDIFLSNKWLLMNAKTADKKKAWKVMELFYSDEFLAGYHEKGLSIVTVPSAVKIAKTPATIQKNPLIAFQANDQTWPNLPTSVTPEGKNWALVMSSIVFGVEKDMNGQLEDLTKRYNAAYDKAKADGKSKQIKIDTFDAANPGKSMAK